MKLLAQRKPQTDAASDHENLFLNRYERMLRWALCLTGGRRPNAEDLVHDAFVQFMLGRPDLSAIRNLDGYLRRMLRYLHLAQARQAAQAQAMPLTITDYDSAEIGLRAAELHTRWQAQESLLQICHYARVRKETSRAGSVLILRFFRDYSPSEIAQVIASPRRAVDDWLRIARREAKLFLEDPRRLKFMAGQQAPSELSVNLTASSNGLMNEMLTAISQSRRGDCFSEAQLRLLYEGAEDRLIDCATLAHIVSCPLCLDQVNLLLGLPSLSSRLTTDPPDQNSEPPGPNDNHGDGPGRAGSDPKEAFLNRSRRQLQQVIEHRPQELRLLVNGLLLGALKLGSEQSELELSLRDEEPVAFVEVFSERGVRLLLFEVAELTSDEQQAQIELSDGRTLDVILKHTTHGPLLHVAYFDPLLREASEGEWGASTPTPLQDGPIAIAAANETATAMARPSTDEHSQPKRRRVFGRPFDIIFNTSWMRPGFITAIISIFLIAALLLVRPRATTVSAESLLHRAAAVEETADALAGKANLVTHRVFTLEERSPSGGRDISRSSIEVWQQAANNSSGGSSKGRTARRLYDDRHGLIAGEWRDADAARTLYRQGSKPQRLDSAHGAITEATLSSEEVWRLTPSAEEFLALIGRVDLAHVEERPTSYVINYRRPDNREKDWSLAQATLVLSKPDLDAIELVLQVRSNQASPLNHSPSADADSTVREYRLTLTSVERRPLDAVPSAVFTPEPELIGSTFDGLKPPRSEKQPLAAVAARPSAYNPIAASAELEIEVLSLLSQVKADLDEPVTVTRTLQGLLRVEALVETTRRKDEIIKALMAVINHPAVKVEVNTVAEAAAKQQAQSPSSTVIVRDMEVAANTLPVDAEMRRYFASAENRSSPREGVDEAIRRFAARMLDRSFAATSHAWALNRLSQRFSPAELQALAPSARDKWRTMIYTHALALRRETESLRHDLQPIFFSSAPASAKPETSEAIALAPVTNDTAVARAIESLFELSISNEKIIRAAFTLSAKKVEDAAIKRLQFWEALRRAERLAANIQESAQPKTPVEQIKPQDRQ